MGERAAHRWDLIGRQSELAVARVALRSDDSGGVLLSGAPGVGKTSIAKAALSEVEEREEHEVLWLMASASGTSIPFGAFAPLVPEIGGQPGRQPDPFYLLQTVRRAVVELAGGKKLVIGVDDAHWLDGQSATLLFQLVATKAAKAVVALRAGAPVAEAVRGLWKEGLVERIDVQPLERDALLAFATDLLERSDTSQEGIVFTSDRSPAPAQVGGELAEALWRVSGGNPLYLRELVFAGRQSERIIIEHGLWRLRGDLELGPRLAELLEERLGRLADGERQALEVVAFADPVPLGVVTRLVPAAELGSMQRQGLIRAEVSHGEQQIRTAHPLYTEAIRAQIPATKANELRLQLADAFEADGRKSAYLLRIVAWRLEAGSLLDPELLTLAATRAAERQDWQLSSRLAAAALEAGGGPEATFALADALRNLGKYQEALGALGDHGGTGDDQVSRAAVLRAFILFWGLGRVEEADSVLATAQSKMTDASVIGLLEAMRAGIANFAGRPHEAVARARPLLDREGMTPRALLAARSALALGLAWSGREDEAIWLALECMSPAFREAGGALSNAWSQSALTLAYRLSGRLRELEELATEQYRLALQLNDRQGHGAAAGSLGWVALPRGQLQMAIARFREAEAALEEADSLGGRIQSLTGLAEALALSGFPDEAESVLQTALREWRHTEASITPRFAVSSAWVIAAKGEIGRALVQLQETADYCKLTRQVAHEVVALTAAVRLGCPDVAARLDELAATVQGPLVSVVAAHASALALGDAAGPELDRVAERYAALTINLYAAECSAQASRAHSVSGRPRRAAAAAARAFGYIAGHEGPRPLGLAIALSPPALTRRENEVAMLAVKGLSSQAIATQLCLSVRTVETHLARVYFKLGIRGRSDLAGALALEREAAAAS